ncbi:MAG TPA: cupin domain-containing protein [Rhizomicrobium sp.]|jgi:quercetin dioxygenase-like cupin family protein
MTGEILNPGMLPVLEKLPGWRGRLFHSATMTFGYWDFDAGSSIHEHFHEQEEVWHLIEGEVEITISGETHRAGAGTVAIVPGNSRHSVKALSNGKAIVVDCPLRKDFAP